MLEELQKKDSKQEIIDRFRENPDIRILISTEVGSEGVDLQFCDTEINYDLPWNPMRLEQRIGRIDRIGQDADNLTIINMICKDSIEDRVLARLYERINIFENSIGEIEEILGPEIQNLMEKVGKGEYKEEDLSKNKTLDEDLNKIANQQAIKQEVEEKASSSFAFGEYIESIKEANKSRLYIRPEDLIFFVKNFLESYPGSYVENVDEKNTSIKKIYLSPDALRLFEHYSQREQCPSKLQNFGGELICLFDSSLKKKFKKKNYDVITPIHPLIKWISDELKGRELQKSCFSVSIKNSEVPKGVYAVLVQELEGNGLINKKVLGYYACRLCDGFRLEPKMAESLLVNFLSDRSKADFFDGWSDCKDSFEKALEDVQNYGDEKFIEFEESFKKKNQKMCSDRLEAIQRTSERKIKSLKENIQKMRFDSRKESVIIATEAQIKSQEQRRIQKESEVKSKEKSTVVANEIAIGLVNVL